MASRDHSIDEWQGPMWNDCGGCNWIRREAGLPEGPASGRRYCALHCAIAEETLRTLASNLAVAALGCWGFHRGVMYGYAASNVVCSQDSPDEWYPGRVLDERPCKHCQRRFVPTTEDFGPDWCGCDETRASAQMEENGE